MKNRIIIISITISGFCFSQQDSLKYYGDIFKDTFNINNDKRLEAANYFSNYIYDNIASVKNHISFYRKHLKSDYSNFYRNYFFNNTYITFILFKDDSEMVLGRLSFYKRKIIGGFLIFNCNELSEFKPCIEYLIQKENKIDKTTRHNN